MPLASSGGTLRNAAGRLAALLAFPHYLPLTRANNSVLAGLVNLAYVGLLAILLL